MRVFIFLLLFVIVIGLVLFIGYGFFVSKNVNQRTNQLSIIPTVSVTVGQPSKNISKTDMSYIVVIVDGVSDLRLFNANKTEVAKSLFHQPLQDQMTKAKNGQGISDIYFSKPESGEYALRISGLNGSGVQILLYDKEGNLNSKEYLKGLAQKTAELKIAFNKENSNLSTVSQISP